MRGACGIDQSLRISRPLTLLGLILPFLKSHRHAFLGITKLMPPLAGLPIPDERAAKMFVRNNGQRMRQVVARQAEMLWDALLGYQLYLAHLPQNER